MNTCDYAWPALATVASGIIECAYVPQLVRLYKLREARAISLVFPAMSVFGRLLAIAYMAHEGQRIFATGICVGVVLRSTFLGQVAYFKWRHWWLKRLSDRSVQI